MLFLPKESDALIFVSKKGATEPFSSEDWGLYGYLADGSLKTVAHISDHEIKNTTGEKLGGKNRLVYAPENMN